MGELAPKTIRGKLLLAYLALVAIFIGAGILILLQLTGLRQSSHTFFENYSEAEDLIIEARFLVGEVSSVVLAPHRSLDPETFIVQTGKRITQLSRRIQLSLLEAEHKDHIAQSLGQYLEVMQPALRLSSLPVERMEEADTLAEQCLHQAEQIHNVELVNAISGIVDAYTDTIIANDPDERARFDQLVRVVENSPAYSAIRSFSALKSAALDVFSSNARFVEAVDRFREADRLLAHDLATIDRRFHANFVLPRQEQLMKYVERSAWVILFAMLFSVGMATLISLMLKKYIWRPLLDMGGMVERMSAGELNHRLPGTGEDEVSSIGRSLNVFADHLKMTLEQLDRQMLEMAEIESNLRKSEEYNRELSQEYQVVLDGISEALMVYDRAGQIIWSNKKASEVMFAEIDQKVSTGDYELNPSSSYSVGELQVEICFDTGDKVEELIRTEDEKYIRVKAFPLVDADGKVQRVLKVIHDVTEQLLLRDEADRTNRLASLGELSAGVAHEINNPNSLVIVNAPILRDAFEDIMPILEEYYKEHGDFRLGGLSYQRLKYDIPLMLKEMHEGGMRIQRIVEDLKNFVRREDAIDIVKVDLNVAVETAIRMMGSLIRSATGKFTCDLKSRLPLIRGNSVQLEQVIVNLVQNACLALPDKGRGLTVRTEIGDDGKHVLLIICDEGVGIAPENLKRVTDPFFTTRRKEGGTGLGLSVSSRIVRDLGGQLLFESKPGEGTTVTVRFPIAG